MKTRADDLAKMTVLDETKQVVELGTLWRDRPVVLVFIRHFGWIHCREHVVQLHRDSDQFRAAGADLVIVGNGPPHFIAGFREHTGYTGPLYTDPSLKVFEAAQLKRGITSTANVRALVSTIKLFAGGGKQGSVQGDGLQQGGALVIMPGGEVKWHHISEHPADRATTQQILAALA